MGLSFSLALVHRFPGRFRTACRSHPHPRLSSSSPTPNLPTCPPSLTPTLLLSSSSASPVGRPEVLPRSPPRSVLSGCPQRCLAADQGPQGAPCPYQPEEGEGRPRTQA